MTVDVKKYHNNYKKVEKLGLVVVQNIPMDYMEIDSIIYMDYNFFNRLVRYMEEERVIRKREI